MQDHFVSDTAWALMEGGWSCILPTEEYVGTVYLGLFLISLLGSWWEQPVFYHKAEADSNSSSG